MKSASCPSLLLSIGSVVMSLTTVSGVRAEANGASVGGTPPFTLGNLLVTHERVLYEYTLSGTQIQSIPIPFPLDEFRRSGDVAYDRFGRAHVVNSSSAGSFISTYDPKTAEWSHTPAPVTFSVLSDGDLSIFGDYLFQRSVRMRVTDFHVEQFDIGMSNGPSETSVGLDGLLYSINSGSPRYRIQRTDPISLLNIGEEFWVRDANNVRLDGRGLAATASGELFVADLDGYIYQFDAEGNYIRNRFTGISSPIELNLRDDGVMVVGGRLGEIAITNTSLGTVSTLRIGDDRVYAGFVVTPVPEPASLVVILASAIVLFCTSSRTQP